jgi:hypothetical protein
MSHKFKSILRHLANYTGGGHYDRNPHDHGHGDYHGHFDGHHGHHQHHGYNFLASSALKLGGSLIDWLRLNKRLAFLIIMGLLVIGLLFIAGLVWLGIKLIALAGPLLTDINSNGLKGIVDEVTKLITRLWEGSGK